MALNLGFQSISSSLDFRTSIANFLKRLCNTDIHLSNSDTNNTLEAFTTSPLIPLNKTPGAHPVGAGEVLRQIARKIVMYIAKKDVKDAAGSLQLCVGQEAR